MRILALLLSLSIPLFSQSAQLAGRITDPSGQAVPSASVTATNEATKVRREATTNSEGLYSIPALTPGVYSVKVSKEGFKSLDRSGVELTVDTRSRVDAQLEVGTVAESVNVTENVGALRLNPRKSQLQSRRARFRICPSSSSGAFVSPPHSFTSPRASRATSASTEQIT